ncbi:MAG: bacteriocin fulvocin C-related protein [Microscillaceae bacterium]|nr:bacteriocin fulvocin C-related protein [Microscillaceae bacterium]
MEVFWKYFYFYPNNSKYFFYEDKIFSRILLLLFVGFLLTDCENQESEEVIQESFNLKKGISYVKIQEYSCDIQRKMIPLLHAKNRYELWQSKLEEVRTYDLSNIQKEFLDQILAHLKTELFDFSSSLQNKMREEFVNRWYKEAQTLFIEEEIISYFGSISSKNAKPIYTTIDKVTDIELKKLLIESSLNSSKSGSNCNCRWGDFFCACEDGSRCGNVVSGTCGFLGFQECTKKCNDPSSSPGGPPIQ